MPLPTPYSLSHLFTNLIARQVAFVRTQAPNEGSVKHVFGVYRCFPKETTVVLKSELSVFGSFAGALIGLPDSEVRTRLAAPALDDVMKDAMSEVLNVASSVVSSEGRAVLIGMEKQT